jgi:hypothetical protein
MVFAESLTGAWAVSDKALIAEIESAVAAAFTESAVASVPSEALLQDVITAAIANIANNFFMFEFLKFMNFGAIVMSFN